MRAVVFDSDHFAQGAAAEIGAALRNQPQGRRINLGLSGGATVPPIFEALRWESVPWERLDLWLSDERWVSPDDEASNGLIPARIFGATEAVLHRPRWSPVLDAEDSAAFYDATLREIVSGGRADVVLLGMGDDGHTASLFPGVEVPEEPWRWFVAVWVEKLEMWRLTSTPWFLQDATQLMVIVAGASKAEVLAEALEGDDGRHPVQLVRKARGEVTFLLDEGAASALRSFPVDRRPAPSS